MGKKGSIFRSVLAVLLIGVLLMGCVSQAPVSNTTQVTPVVEEKQAEVPKNTQPVTIEESTMIKTADSKNSTEKVEESVERVVADGTYTNSLQYNYHSGSETVAVKVVVKDDVITETSVSPSENAHENSKKIITSFNGALPELVVGKKIDELNIPKNVAGSSLTSAAFKAYVEKLIEEN